LAWADRKESPLTRHIGIVACSAEGAALCYRTICTEAPSRLGCFAHPEVSLHTHDFAEYMRRIDAGDWPGVAELMLDSAGKLAAVGADLLICPDNTIHQAMPRVTPSSPAPWLHIAEEVVRAAREDGRRRLAVLGTRYLMDGPVYREAAAAAGLEIAVPDAPRREEIHRIIFEECIAGRFLPDSRAFLNEVIAAMRAEGCDAAVLGCTELPLLADAATAALPLLDSTRLLARAALREAIGD